MYCILSSSEFFFLFFTGTKLVHAYVQPRPQILSSLLIKVHTHTHTHKHTFPHEGWPNVEFIKTKWGKRRGYVWVPKLVTRFKCKLASKLTNWASGRVAAILYHSANSRDPGPGTQNKHLKTLTKLDELKRQLGKCSHSPQTF